MSNKAALEQIRFEKACDVYDLHSYRLASGEFTEVDADFFAKRAASRDRSDPFIYARVRSGLMQGHLQPEDFPRRPTDAWHRFDANYKKGILA